MFCVYTEVKAQADSVFFNETTPHSQLLPLSKVDQSKCAFMRCRLYSKKSSNTIVSFHLVS